MDAFPTIQTATYDTGTHLAPGGDHLCLHRNENLFVDREWAVTTAQRAIAAMNIAAYPDPASAALRAALAEWHGLTPAHVFVGNGSDEVLSDLLMVSRPRCERLGILDVCFRMYPLLAERFGYTIVRLPGDTFTTGRVAPGRRPLVVLVDSPNAISGRPLGLEDLHALREAASLLIWDNAYGEYAGDVVPAPLPDRLVLVRSFSKFYGIAGVRIGYCVASPALVEELHARKDPFNVNTLAQAMALEALKRHDELRAMAAEMIRCRTLLVEGLERLGFCVCPSRANFVLAKHPRHTGAFLEAALHGRRIAVRRFPGAPTDDHVRITVPPEPAVCRLLLALGDVVAAD